MTTGQAVRIFVIEDEEDIAELICFNLRLEGFEARSFPTGESGLQALMESPPDLLVLDLMLPGLNGIEICRRLQQHEDLKNIPIVMVTAKGEETDVVQGLESGARDYITKPFSPRILIARVKAALRSGSSQSPLSGASVLKAHGIELHPGRHEVQVNSENIDLTHSEFEILRFLMRKKGWVFTRGQIVDAVRGDNYAVTDRSIDFQMVGLRRKLGESGECIETVRGVGYRFKE